MTKQEQMQVMLESLEDTIMQKMADASGVQKFQMVSMVKRCDELKEYYCQLRSDIIKSMAADLA